MRCGPVSASCVHVQEPSGGRLRAWVPPRGVTPSASLHGQPWRHWGGRPHAEVSVALGPASSRKAQARSQAAEGGAEDQGCPPPAHPCLFCPDCGPEEDDAPAAADAWQDRGQVLHHRKTRCGWGLLPAWPWGWTGRRGAGEAWGARACSPAWPLPQGGGRGHLREQWLCGALLPGQEAGRQGRWLPMARPAPHPPQGPHQPWPLPQQRYL